MYTALLVWPFFKSTDRANTANQSIGNRSPPTEMYMFSVTRIRDFNDTFSTVRYSFTYGVNDFFRIRLSRPVRVRVSLIVVSLLHLSSRNCQRAARIIFNRAYYIFRSSAKSIYFFLPPPVITTSYYPPRGPTVYAAQHDIELHARRI